MKKKVLVALTAALAGAAGWTPAALAQSTAEAGPIAFTGNLTLASEYRYRGIAQTNGKPAIQGGFDLAHNSGAYIGTWASNVSWLSDAGGGEVSNSMEWDVYGGYKGAVGDFGYDVGLLYYYYPGRYPKNVGYNSPNTLEAYVAGSWKTLTLKYSHALTDLFGFVDSKGAGYLDLTGNFDVGAGFTLVAHVGYQRIPATSETDPARTRRDCSYSDWRIGVTKELAGLTWGLAYVDTNAKGGDGECYRNPFSRDLGKATAVLTVGKTF